MNITKCNFVSGNSSVKSSEKEIIKLNASVNDKNAAKLSEDPSGFYNRISFGQQVCNTKTSMANASSLKDVIKNTDNMSLKNILYQITNDENLAFRLIDELVQNPADNKDFASYLLKTMGQKDFQSWYVHSYKPQYEKYINKRMENAESVDELVQIQPNWAPWTLESRFGTEYTIGTLPDNLSVEDFRSDFKKLLHSEETDKVKQIKQDKMGGFSVKNILPVRIGDKEYILKYEPNPFDLSPELESLADSNEDLMNYLNRAQALFTLTGDSCFTNAMIDFYLQLNGNKETSQILFYDNKTKASLYEYVKGTASDSLTDKQDYIDNSEAKNLGIFYSDISPNNILTQADGTRKNIDVGNSVFCDILKPQVKAIHVTMPNACGVDPLEFHTGLNIIDN